MHVTKQVRANLATIHNTLRRSTSINLELGIVRLLQYTKNQLLFFSGGGGIILVPFSKD